jgi:hypothetical protein
MLTICWNSDNPGMGVCKYTGCRRFGINDMLTICWNSDNPGWGRANHGRRIIVFSGKFSGEVQQLVILKFLTS